MVKGRPVDCTGTRVIDGSSVPKVIIPMRLLRNHGRPRPIKMSKIFEPSVLHSAMSARPARFTTSTEEISSGIEVPAGIKRKLLGVLGLFQKFLPASSVSPLMVSGTPNV